MAGRPRLTARGVILRTHSSAEALTVGAAERFTDLAAIAIGERARFSVALAGGSTPRALYRLLASDTYARRIDWERVHCFWGDERCVPPDDRESNYRMANEALLAKLQLPPENIHRIRGELDPHDAATEYEQGLRHFFGDEGRLDLVLLGLGDDGHTASLFPGSEAVQRELRGEQERWVVANYIERLGVWRVTLTTLPINRARTVMVLVSGGRKARALRCVLEGTDSPDRVPAALIAPTSGQLVWLVDDDAVQEWQSHHQTGPGAR